MTRKTVTRRLDDHVLPPSAERVMEAVREEANVYRLWSVPGGAECDAVDFSLHALATRRPTNVGRQRVYGPAVHFGINGCRDNVDSADSAVNALVRGASRRRFGGQG